jgi:hypothetical protein
MERTLGSELLEVADNPTFSALTGLFLGLPVDREEMVRGTASGMEGFQATFNLFGWLKTKADCDMAFCLTHLDDPAYCFSANLGGCAEGFNSGQR